MRAARNASVPPVSIAVTALRRFTARPRAISAARVLVAPLIAAARIAGASLIALTANRFSLLTALTAERFDC